MSFLSLPVELLDSICQNVASTDLVALSRTCCALSPVAQRLLYRHLSVSSWRRNFRVVKTLAVRADIARHVRSFSITVDAQNPAFHSFYRLLARAMSNMSELTSLDLFVDSDMSWILGGAGRTCLYSRLERFACPFPFDPHVVAFLNKTPALTELEVDSIPDTSATLSLALPSTSVPRLVHFVGSVRAAKVIVPGRPLQSLHLHEGDVTEDDITWLSEASARVVILAVTTGALPIPFLNELSRSLPYLAYLRIMTTYNFTKAPDVDFCREIAHALGALPDLTAFELSGIHWGSSPNGDSGSKRVWQSKPFTDDFEREDEVPIGSDIFLAY